MNSTKPEAITICSVLPELLIFSYPLPSPQKTRLPSTLELSYPLVVTVS